MRLRRNAVAAPPRHNASVSVTFECRTVIAAPISVVFDLALDIDAHVESQAQSRERAVAGVTSGTIGLGEQVTWRAVHFGVPFKMTSRITEFDRPSRFVDEQVRGPFRRFRHEHLFERYEANTMMIDRLDFDAPVGPLGRVVERVLLERYLRKLIEERGSFLKAKAEPRSR
jgi:ligand-binding SRPBCC domain-containing protein